MISVPTKTPWPTGAWILIASGAALLVGAFLPWLEATTIFGNITRSGVSYGPDALVTAGIGTALGVLGILLVTGQTIPRWIRMLAIVAAAAALAIVVYDYGRLENRANSVVSDVAQASVGIGLWLSLAGAIIGIVGGWLSRQ
jgi:hypothetical protein